MGIINYTFDKNKFNCLTCPTHERTQSNMDFDFCDFYMFKSNGIKNWNSEYAEIPKNHYLLKENYFPHGIPIDFVLSQNKFGQFQVLHRFARKIMCPLVTIEHTLPLQSWSKEDFNKIKSLKGDVNIYISEFSAKTWEDDNPIIFNHCVDVNMFKPLGIERKNHILTVANDYVNRDSVLNFSQYRRVTSGLPVFPVGDTPGFSKAAKSVEELATFYSSSRIFLNTAHWSPIPTSLLEAMSSGCACVSCNTCAIPEYIEHGVNGFLAYNDKEMRDYLMLLLKDEDLAKTLGENARKTIIEKCSKELYTKKWHGLFKKLFNLGDRIES